MESGEGTAFDILAFHGSKCIRIQSKATQTRSPTGIYSFITAKGRYAPSGKHTVPLTTYSDSEIDVIACVALPIERVVFVPISDITGSRIKLLEPAFTKTDAAKDTLFAALKVQKIL